MAFASIADDFPAVLDACSSPPVSVPLCDPLPLAVLTVVLCDPDPVTGGEVAASAPLARWLTPPR